jgi:hypothetical protein
VMLMLPCVTVGFRVIPLDFHGGILLFGLPLVHVIVFNLISPRWPGWHCASSGWRWDLACCICLRRWHSGDVLGGCRGFELQAIAARGRAAICARIRRRSISLYFTLPTVPATTPLVGTSNPRPDTRGARDQQETVIVVVGVLWAIDVLAFRAPLLLLAGRLVLQVPLEEGTLPVRADRALGCASSVRAERSRVRRRQSRPGTLAVRLELLSGWSTKLVTLLPCRTGGVAAEAFRAVWIIVGFTAGETLPAGAVVGAALAVTAAAARLALALWLAFAAASNCGQLMRTSALAVAASHLSSQLRGDALDIGVGEASLSLRWHDALREARHGAAVVETQTVCSAT